MPLRWRAGLPSRSISSARTQSARWILLLGLSALWIAAVGAMTTERIAELRKETVSMFYHGFDNYMDIAFPEDELRPISCVPLTRDQRNPNHFELNDVLGNYSLTLIDSLSTLAILASAPPDQAGTSAKALSDFQNGVAKLVLQYGDGTMARTGKGMRARGFDVDSKVQVFETVIRGVGGLLSAHLFAAGELPISNYVLKYARNTKNDNQLQKGEIPAILWPNGFKYDGQLLRLALDLGQRLLPAFFTATGIPYPRVNLRHGIPFFTNSPLHQGSEGDFTQDGPPEVTETCSAGAGSLVLEFTLLSRLTGDPRFEQLAKRAFWAVWNRRSTIGLLGAGIDAENGQWIGIFAGIGAGTDSFFEYALKTHILLSGHELPNQTLPSQGRHNTLLDPNSLFTPLTPLENSPEAFLAAWHEAHAAVKRHLYSSIHHPHYVNAHLSTGSPLAYWIDSLGAYYPGLLTLAGEVEEAIETNLLYTALWTRYGALPERWSVANTQVEGGLGWWPGRPEFIESNYHLYRATRDPWYLHVGEMVLKDIQRRCRTRCGWSGLQDVQTGEKNDRMESFFLGETAKYLYLLFDPDHPLNNLDAAYVFTTEGHPLIIPPDKTLYVRRKQNIAPTKDLVVESSETFRDTCPVPAGPIPFTISATAARRDIFHAANLIGLHRVPNIHVTIEPDSKKTSTSTAAAAQIQPNYTYYPWTLPESLIPINGSCDKLPMKQTFTIEFPVQATQTPTTPDRSNIVFPTQNLIRVDNGMGILAKSLSGLKLGMVYESPSPFRSTEGPLMESWRIWSIAGINLGRDEQIYIPRDVVGDMNDPSFARIRDTVMIDLVLQLETNHEITNKTSHEDEEYTHDFDDEDTQYEDKLSSGGLASEYASLFTSILQSILPASLMPTSLPTPRPSAPKPPTHHLMFLPAITPTGIGAATLPDLCEAPHPELGPIPASLLFTKIYFADSACDGKLPSNVPKDYEILVVRRGGCMFAEKLSNIPSFTPTAQSLKLVIVVSGDEDDDERRRKPDLEGNYLIRPLLHQVQRTPSGLIRHNAIPMVMVGGGSEAENLLRKAKSIGIRRRYHIESGGLMVGNCIVV